MTITVTLPLVDPTGAARSSKQATTSTSPVVRAERAATTLVAEDEAEILQLNADVLRSAGHRVYEALDGHEALEILPGGAHVDLFLTDSVMPGMSGAELASRVNDLGRGIAVLYLSGYAAANQATEEIDPSRLHVKPIGGDELVRALSEALARET